MYAKKKLGRTVKHQIFFICVRLLKSTKCVVQNYNVKKKNFHRGNERIQQKKCTLRKRVNVVVHMLRIVIATVTADKNPTVINRRLELHYPPPDQLIKLMSFLFRTIVGDDERPLVLFVRSWRFLKLRRRFHVKR